MPARQIPKAAIRQGFQSVSDRKISFPVPFALEGEHGVRTGMNAAVDHARKMHAQKREVRIRHGINQRLHQIALFGDKFEVFASEWDDLRAWLRAAGARQAIAE